MPKEKFILEYDLRKTPVEMLWSYISTENGLSEWFADDVRIKGKDVVFIWSGVGQEAHIVAVRTDKYIRYHWKDDADKHYFELKISVSELTDGLVLTVTDWAESEELDESKDLWNSQIEDLQRQLGCC